MNKNSQMLYLSGLISEEQLTETSDFEHGVASVQKMQNEFNELYEKLLDCVDTCRNLQKQAIANHSYHDKVGLERIDSNGIGDAQYFEDVSHKIAVLHMALLRLFDPRKPLDEVKESFQELIKRLNTDFEPT